MYDSEKEDLLLTVHQDSACWTNDYEDLLVYDVQDQLIFSVEYEERTGYLSTLMVLGPQIGLRVFIKPRS